MDCARCGQSLPSDAAVCPACGEPAGGVDQTRIAASPENTLDEGSYEATRIRHSGEFATLEGKWSLEAKLGEGGMGAVYRAKDLALGRTVAVKLLSSKLSNDPEFVTRFEREAKTMAQLEHPNLIPIYAVGRHHDAPFIVMKFLEGTTLDEYSRKRRILVIDEVLSIARQLCSGLGFFHARGVVHRDIKPANVFISPEGHLTILDLGLVHIDQPEGEGLTRMGLLVGTPGYIPPEQAISATGLDARADLYAVGVILFELLTGKPPYQAASDIEMLIAHRDEPVPDASTMEVGVSPELGAVLQRAMAKEKQDRYSSADELFKAFELAARARPPDDRTHVVMAPLAPPARRSKPPISASGRSPVRRSRPSASKTAGLPASTMRMPARELPPPPVPDEPTTLDTSAETGGPGEHPIAVTDVPVKATQQDIPVLEPRSRLPVVLGAVCVALLLILAALGWRYFAQREGPAAGSDDVVDPAPAPEAGAEPEPPAPAPVTPEPPKPDPDPELAKVPEPPKAEDPSESPEDPKAAAPKHNPKAHAPRQKGPRTTAQVNGTVNVNVTLNGRRSWGYIFVNGEKQAEQAPAALSLKPGTYRIRVMQPGGGAAEKAVTVASGRVHALPMALKQ